MTALNGKTALVTGASRGIGKAIAIALADEGARVLVHYGSSRDEADSVAQGIRERGGSADTTGADLSALEGVHALAASVRKAVGDRLDILILNAGISKAAKLEDHTAEDVDNLFATNLRAPFLLVQQLLPVLKEGSSVVAISSLGARNVVGAPSLESPSLLAYTSTKGALETLVKNWAALLGPRGVRVNAVAPGIIDCGDGHAGAQANRKTGRCRRSRGLPGFRPGTLDYRCKYPGGWWLETLDLSE